MATISKYHSQKNSMILKKIYTRFSEAHFQAQLQSLPPLFNGPYDMAHMIKLYISLTSHSFCSRLNYFSVGLVYYLKW